MSVAKWRLSPVVVVRTTGFSVDLLAPLRFTETVAAIRAVLDADREVAGHVARITAVIRERRNDKEIRRELDRARRKVAAGQPISATDLLGDDYNAALARRDELVEIARKAYEQELPRRRRALAEAVSRPDVQEALLLSSPDMLATTRRYTASFDERRTADVRKVERRLAAYLQRLAVKNETNSFFGPVNYGHLTDHAENLVVRRNGPVRRHVFAAQWMVEALASAIGADPAVRPHLTPRRKAGQDTELHRLADGTRTTTELARLLGLGEDEAWHRILAAGLVTGPVVPPDVADPLGWLADWAARLPGEHWRTVLARFAEMITSFATADLAGRERLLAAIEHEFTEITGEPARRNGGRMYADRSVLYEECRGDLTVDIGGRLREDLLQRVQPVLRLAEANGILRWRRDQAAALRLWQRLARDGAVPLLRYLRELAAHPVSTTESDELEEFTTALRDLVIARSDGEVARLTADELPIPPLPETLRLTSLDLMLTADDHRVVVGEVHAQPLTWAFPMGHFLSDADRAQLRSDLHGVVDGHDLATFAHTRTSKVYPYPLPGAVLELRPRLPEATPVPAVDIEVVRDEHGLALRTPKHDLLRLYPPLHQRDDPLDPVAPLAHPAIVPPVVDCGEHTPRIEIDGLVLQRERWVLPGGGLVGNQPDKDFARFLAAWRMKERVGLPDEIYVRVRAERKPVLVAFDNGFLVEIFDHLSRLADEVVVTEALPSTSQLWLDGPDGRHTCEFRTIAMGAT